MVEKLWTVIVVLLVVIAVLSIRFSWLRPFPLGRFGFGFGALLCFLVAVHEVDNPLMQFEAFSTGVWHGCCLTKVDQRSIQELQLV